MKTDIHQSSREVTPSYNNLVLRSNIFGPLRSKKYSELVIDPTSQTNINHQVNSSFYLGEKYKYLYFIVLWCSFIQISIHNLKNAFVLKTYGHNRFSLNFTTILPRKNSERTIDTHAQYSFLKCLLFNALLRLRVFLVFNRWALKRNDSFINYSLDSRSRSRYRGHKLCRRI